MNGLLDLIGAILFISLELSFMTFAILYPILEPGWWRYPVGRALEGIFVIMAVTMGFFTLRAFVQIPGLIGVRLILFGLLNVASWGFSVLLFRFYWDRRRPGGTLAGRKLRSWRTRWKPTRSPRSRRSSSSRTGRASSR